MFERIVAACILREKDWKLDQSSIWTQLFLVDGEKLQIDGLGYLGNSQSKQYKFDLGGENVI